MHFRVIGNACKLHVFDPDHDTICMYNVHTTQVRRLRYHGRKKVPEVDRERGGRI